MFVCLQVKAFFMVADCVLVPNMLPTAMFMGGKNNKI